MNVIDDSAIISALHNVNECDTKESAWIVVLDAAEGFGFKQVLYGPLYQPGSHEPFYQSFLNHGFSHNIVDAYEANDFAAVNPIPAIASRMVKPIRWRPYLDRLRPTSKKQAQYVEWVRGIDLDDGIICPAYGPHSHHATVGFSKRTQGLDLSPRELNGLQALSQAFHSKLVAFAMTCTGDTPHLSPREQEILSLIADGQTNRAIAKVTGISVNTVDAHLRRVFAKLHVSDRTAAAIKGVALGLIG